MPPITPLHVSTVNRLNWLLVRDVGDGFCAITVARLRLLPRSEPHRDFYASAHPTAEDVFLVIEVADSTLRKDRTVKVPIYARQGVTEVWLVDLSAGAVTVYADPVDGGYRDVRSLHGEESLSPRALPQLRLTVSDILGT